MQGDTAKAKAAYQDFLTLWKDADPDIPIFIAAKAEYAKLQWVGGEICDVRRLESGLTSSHLRCPIGCTSATGSRVNSLKSQRVGRTL
jgi:hypothetical protein